MKINIDGIDIEGTPEEIAQLMAMRAAITSPSVSQPTPSPKSQLVHKPTMTTRQLPPSHAEDEEIDTELEDFLKALYRYKADKHTAPGRAPYVIKLLRSGKQFTIAQLQRLSNANQTTVASAIHRAADAGCVIEITGNSLKLYPNTKVKMTKLGTVEEAAKAKLLRAPSQINTSTKLLQPSNDNQREALLRLLESKNDES